MRILVTVASRHGGTLEMATAIAKAMIEDGLEVDVKPIEELDGVAGYQGVVLGSGVYVGRWLSEATEFARRHQVELRARAVWLFSSGPIGSPNPKPVGDPQGIAEVAASIGARGHRVFAGRLDRGRIGLSEKLIVSAVHAPDGDFRDWDALAAWGHEVAGQMQGVPAMAG